MRITRTLLEVRLAARIEEYEEAAQLPYDYSNGWAQIEAKREYLGERLVRIAVLYGQIEELRSLLGE